MLNHLRTEDILFLDIETVPAYADYSQLDEREMMLWNKKAQHLNTHAAEQPTPESTYQRAGIYAEFGKIICICVGAYTKGVLRVKSFASHNEKELLTDFAALLNTYYNQPQHLLCAHNGKEFDFPFMARRMLINGISLPVMLDMAGKKPWEIKHLDTMELWKFGDYKNYTSLDLLAHIFNIPSPKDDIDGSEVANVYYKENNLARIVKYCAKDVFTLFQIYRRYRGEDLLPAENMQVVN